MPNSQDQDAQGIVLYVIDDAVVADAKAIAICRPSQLLAAPRARGVHERLHALSDSSLDSPFKLRERAGRRWSELDIVSSHASDECGSGIAKGSRRVE